ncbi:hypothetical protein ACEWY4_027672 [Coilia grayii]|uniref:Reverse transcriptase domain-containing protein n=1 Tax=Coilia grayii TaxID=363190 RepID=A0ABD1INZ8_9TELE
MFPVVTTCPLHGTAEALSTWMEVQLCYLQDVIQPQLKTWTSRTKKISRDKLAYLWQHRRTKAINIILNNSVYPDAHPCPDNVQEVQSFYFNKCQACSPTSIDDDLLPPPWANSLNLPEPNHPPVCSLFTEVELGKVLNSLPRHKSSGSDGVTYETLKSINWKDPFLPTFNTCLINRRVPKSWKGALIHRIPKKDNVPSDPCTWRDISFLPTIYKVFMKCILCRILPWLVDEYILSTKQKAYIDRQRMHEHVFCLKAAIDDFKHESTKFFSVFLDFRDAFGTLPHSILAFCKSLWIKASAKCNVM